MELISWKGTPEKNKYNVLNIIIKQVINETIPKIKANLIGASVKGVNDISKKLKIEFLSTAFDLESLDFLKQLGQKRFKIPSGEITNLSYLTSNQDAVTKHYVDTANSSSTE